MATQILNSFKPRWKPIVVTFLVIIYILINLFRVGGDEFILNLNSYIIFPFAIATVILAYKLARQIQAKGKNRLLWWGLFIGWSLWLFAHVLFTIVPEFTGEEIPYPSWADFFWILGYLPMYIALSERLRTLPKTSSSAQKLAIWVSTLISLIGAIVFVIIPIIQNNDPDAILQNILNIVYPLLDLGLMILVIRIFFIYQQGRYGQVWRWFSIGFIFSSFADLLFASLTTFGLYYPDGEANFLSTIVTDVPFNLSYLFWPIGLILLQSIQNSHQVFEDVHIRVNLVPNTHLLIFTRADDIIIDVSANYAKIFPANMAKGNTLQDALGISLEEAESILKDSKTGKIIKERSLLATTIEGQARVWASGIVVLSPQGKYSGLCLLLRLFHTDYSLEKLLTDNEKADIQSILTKAETGQKEQEEIKQLLAHYDRAFLRALYNRVFNEGGSIMADTFLAELQSVAKENQWQVKIQPSNLLDVSALSLSEARKASHTILETAKRFVIEVIDEASIQLITQDAHSKFDQMALENITHFTEPENA